jgi:ABC-type nitrate/sulfonate/bicarbonate transport system substrate-binding protein
MFDAKNLDVKISQQVNGPGIYTQLANGESDIGFLGAPPMTIRSMNAEQIKA